MKTTVEMLRQILRKHTEGSERWASLNAVMPGS